MGNDGIADNVLRYGWGSENANFRVTTSRRADNGSLNVFDDKRISQLHFRADFQNEGDEILLTAGGSNNLSGAGEKGSTNNAERTTKTSLSYVQLHITRQLDQNDSVSLSGGVDEEVFDDRFAFTSIPGITIDSSGEARRHNLELSFTTQQNENLRTVWGTSWRHESVSSKSLFYGQGAVSQQQLRWFANAEWRPYSQWVLNAGGLIEQNSIVGNSFAPRVMLNYHFLPDHTFRIGATKATRSPSLYELRGDTRYYHPTTGALLQRTVAATGGVKSEKLISREIGYLGEFRDYGLTIDARAFIESLGGVVVSRDYAATPVPALSANSKDFFNFFNPEIRGLEYQLRWRPVDGTQLMFNQAYIKIRSDEPIQEMSAPRVSYSTAWFQKLPANFDFSLMYSHVGEMSWGNVNERITAYDVVDMRLARSFKLGTTPAELAITTQSANGSHLEFLIPTSATPNPPITGRRTFATLRLEF